MQTQINAVVSSLRRVALRQEEGALTDGQLLARFIEEREPATIAALLERHGPMVWRVCRRLLRNHHDAEDAFQATFLVLVRKAASIRHRELMAHWLYGVAHQTARKARQMIAKRRTRETQGAMPEPQAPEYAGQSDLPGLLDLELSRLPDKYRVAIVLCDLEGKTRQEAARQLGLPEGTMAGRLTRGRALLARRLARHGMAVHGLAVSGGALAAVFAQEAAAASVPISLLAATSKAANLFAAGQAAAAGAISVRVTALTEGVLKAMLLAKLRIPLLLVVALALAGVGVAQRVVQTQGAETPQAAPKREQPAPGGQAVAAPQAGAAKTATVRAQEILNDALKEFEAAADEPGGRHRLLADLAGVQAQLGDRDATKRLFARATEFIAAMPEAQQADGWQRLASAAAHAGAVDEALAAARRVPAGNQVPNRDRALQSLATALARERLEREALRVAAMVEDEELKAWLRVKLLDDLALAYAAAGNIPEGLRVVERMKDASSQVTALLGRFQLQLNYDYPFSPTAQGIALRQAKAGDKAGAGKSLRRAADLIAALPANTPAPSRALALTKLACAQARLGEFANARKTMASIQHETGKTIALAMLVRQLARTGRAKDALAELDPIPVGAVRAHLLTQLGAGQAEAGDQQAARASFQKAHVLLEQVQDEEQRSSLGLILGTVRAEAGDYKGALQTADKYFPDSDLGYANVAYAQAKGGDFTGALATAEKIKSRTGQGPAWWQLQSLWATAELQAQRGQAKAAREWIEQLDSHLARAHALAGLAKGTLTAQGQPGKK